MFSKRLKELRKEKQVHQKDIAEYLGITPNAYGLYERGERKPNPDTLLMLADYFDVSVDYLLGRSDIRTSNSLDGKKIHDITKEIDQVVEHLNEIRKKLKK